MPASASKTAVRKGSRGHAVDPIEFISEVMTLFPGDVISTGTPSGVGFFRSLPVVLAAGNLVECRIEKIGAIVNPVVDRLPG